DLDEHGSIHTTNEISHKNNERTDLLIPICAQTHEIDLESLQKRLHKVAHVAHILRHALHNPVIKINDEA
ncbi:hypothetical protein CL658_03020, partial [bacterium]|nr:hypothetical protein [bacterium]